jgi:FAD/FMN-containing dehydrogenase
LGVQLTRRTFLQGFGGFVAVSSLGCTSASPSIADGHGAADAGAADAGEADAGEADAGEADASSADAAPPPALTGRVVRPGDADYDAARADWNGRFSIRPQAIVFAATVDDVRNAIAWARQEGVPLRPRCGRHSYEAFSLVENGLVLDVSAMNDVVLDAGSGHVRIGAGANLGIVYERLIQDHRTIAAGSCATVGVAGLTLGGGVGLLGRKAGLTCDQVVSLDLVTAAGDLVTASADQNADLYWALRGGGGGNFGVVTAFEMVTLPAPDVAVYSVSWSINDLPDVLRAWQSWAPVTDPSLTSILTISTRKVFSAGQYLGSTDDLQRLLAPLLAAGTPANLQIRMISFMDALALFGGDTADMHPKFKNSSAYAPAALSDEAIAAILERMQAAPGPTNSIQLDGLGGAIAAVGAADTAFPHRGALFSMQIGATWTDDADEAPNRAWVASVRTALLPFTAGAYVNYIDADIDGFAAAYYGANLPRLQAVKRQVDPDGFFSFPQAIPT